MKVSSKLLVISILFCWHGVFAQTTEGIACEGGKHIVTMQNEGVGVWLPAATIPLPPLTTACVIGPQLIAYGTTAHYTIMLYQNEANTPPMTVKVRNTSCSIPFTCRSFDFQLHNEGLGWFTYTCGIGIPRWLLRFLPELFITNEITVNDSSGRSSKSVTMELQCKGTL